MKELNDEVNPTVLNPNDEVISFKCELQENLQKAMKEFVEKHPNWDQYRITFTQSHLGLLGFDFGSKYFESLSN